MIHNRIIVIIFTKPEIQIFHSGKFIADNLPCSESFKISTYKSNILIAYRHQSRSENRWEIMSHRLNSSCHGNQSKFLSSFPNSLDGLLSAEAEETWRKLFFFAPVSCLSIRRRLSSFLPGSPLYSLSLSLSSSF